MEIDFANEVCKIANKKKYRGNGFIQKIVEKLPIELHIPGYNYCGPGTKLKERLERGDQPINKVDTVCMKHDIAYSKAENNQDIKQADDEMIKELDTIHKPSIGERIGKTIAKTGIKAKQLFGGGMIYCLRCKKQTPTLNTSESVAKNGRNMIKGVCEVCGSKKSRFLCLK